MGMQTAVAMTEVDEAVFLAFLRDSAEIRLIRDFAPTCEDLWTDTMEPRGPGNWSYSLWNTRFAWEPEYGQVTASASGDRQGHCYVSRTSQAPIIDYSRHHFDNAQGTMYGRVYWAKCRVTDGGRWYDQCVRWIRKNGRQKEKGAYYPYYLPDAWAKYGAQEP